MSQIYTRAQATAFLTRAGWVIAAPKVRAASYGDAVEDFQRAYNLAGAKVGSRAIGALKADRIVGIDTTAAMIESQRQGYRLSKNFRSVEFRCGCKGVSIGCRSIRATRALLIGLEKVRAAGFPSGLRLTTSYRCPVYNRKIGGRISPPSHHVAGNAVDIPRVLKASQINPAWGFRGIGVTRWDILRRNINDRRVVHLDMGESRRLVFQE